MTARLPVAVIGGGATGLRHAHLIASRPDLRLTAVMDPGAEGRERASEQGFPTASDLDQIPADTRAVIVATPPTSHAAVAEAAASLGWAILMDRCLAISLRDGRRVIAAAEGRVPLLVGHQRRHHPAVSAAREAAKGGLLGRLVAADAVWFRRRPDDERRYAWRVSSGGGPVLGQIVHDVDLLRWLIGEISEVTALVSRPTRAAAAEDTVAAAFRFRGGSLATVVVTDAALAPWGWEAATGESPDHAASFEDCLRIVGSEGAMALPSLAFWRHAGEGRGDWSKPLTRLPLPCPPADPQALQLAHFAAVARGEAQPLVSGEDGLATLAAALAIEESARLGTPVNPDPGRPEAWEPTAQAILRDLSSPERLG